MRVNNTMIYGYGMDRQHQKISSARTQWQDNLVNEQHASQSSTNMYPAVTCETCSLPDVFKSMMGETGLASIEFKDEKPQTFEAFAKDMDLKGLGLTDKEMKQVKAHYEKALKAEKEGKFEEAEKAWDSLFKIVDTKQVKQNYDSFVKDLGIDKLKLTSQDKLKIKSLFEKSEKEYIDGKFDKGDKTTEELLNFIEKKSPGFKKKNGLDEKAELIPMHAQIAYDAFFDEGPKWKAEDILNQSIFI